MANRHKVFISHYHKDDQYYKDRLLRMNDVHNMFVDYSVREREIDDEGLSSERVRCIIRDEYIRDATVFVLLCGPNTKRRKHIDWEIHAAMFDTESNPQMGIIVINLPESNNCCRASDDSEKPLVAPDSEWTSCSSRKELEEKYPSMPSRIVDNFVKGAPISVLNWERVSEKPEVLTQLIDNAYRRRKTIEYDHSALLRSSNS